MYVKVASFDEDLRKNTNILIKFLLIPLTKFPSSEACDTAVE